MTATESNREVNVLIGSNTEYMKNQTLTYSHYRSCLLTVIFSIISGEQTRKLSLRRRHDAVRMRREGGIRPESLQPPIKSTST